MRLIDADALMEQPIWLCGGWVGDSYAEGYMDALDKVEETVKSAPTIDAEPVVRCKDCEHWDVSKNEYSICCHAYHNMMMVRSDGMGFCSDGERKDNETD